MVALGAFLGIIQMIWALLLIPTHLALTVIVYRDAKRLSQTALGLSPFLWLGITFSLPIIGMLIYWIMNYSSLSRDSLYKL
ncbi:hypothetical protein [Desulfitobacterium metallireducens]|uniref:Cardiolipin synthase N-terminal domain-containing protein n=1 Tax=Desulfitobacterium metallireducens DSM 15288 TaxID=871968 RepID=W0EH66_9FIRM|nr:hypothetical protein [Desulfitobacterium metallireducens]AHF08411.1 hypothetical protein DESME_02140 [Desulfitobacterium metallireducens DSM 15288]